MVKRFSVLLSVILISACSNPQSGPDKSLGGALMGAGWGAGTGAVIGNQLSYTGEGAAIGAGFGLVSGAISGGGYDLAEGAMLEEERQLASLKVQNVANARHLDSVQGQLDRAINRGSLGGAYQVFFDNDGTNLRAGSLANLEVLAESLKRDPSASVVHVVGHADDSGDVEYNQRISEARARAVSAYLAARGISLDQIEVRSFGSQRPLVSNSSPEGRQLNRRVDIYIGKN